MDDPISGLCIFRSLRHTLNIVDFLEVLYQEYIVPDRFYTSNERNETMYEIIHEGELTGRYTVKDLEMGLQTEIRRRDRSPLPRDYDELAQSEDQGSFINKRYDDLVTHVSGSLLMNVLNIFIYPSKMEEMKKKKVLDPAQKYSIEILGQLTDFLKPELAILPLEDICNIFQCFLEVPYIRQVLGDEVPLIFSPIHRYAYSSKLDRIRDEVSHAQRLNASRPYVVKFFDVVFERVAEDHLTYESAYFGTRKALVDRLEQLPTGTKGKAPFIYEFLAFDEKKRIELNLDELATVHPFLRQRLETPAGKIFQQSFLDHLEKTFPGKSNPKPSRAALLFAEKFFVWAATTLEFEKELVEPIKSTYTYNSIPYDKMIPLRVLHMCTHERQFGLCFFDEIRHTLYKYQSIYGDLPITVPPPRTGPSCLNVQYIAASVFEHQIRDMTKNRVVFEMVPFKFHHQKKTWFPMLGPFNRHVISAQFILNDIVRILKDELKIGFKLDPAHPEVVAFGKRTAEMYTGMNRSALIDMEAGLNLKWQANSLKKFLVEKAPSSDYFAGLQFKVCEMIGFYGKAAEFAERIQVVQALPMLGHIIHILDCTGDVCCMSFSADFKPAFGPLEEDNQLQPVIHYQLRCDAVIDRQTTFASLDDIFK